VVDWHIAVTVRKVWMVWISQATKDGSSFIVQYKVNRPRVTRGSEEEGKGTLWASPIFRGVWDPLLFALYKP